jgi:hypothetical protein
MPAATLFMPFINNSTLTVTLGTIKTHSTRRSKKKPPNSVQRPNSSTNRSFLTSNRIGYGKGEKRRIFVLLKRTNESKS